MILKEKEITLYLYKHTLIIHVTMVTGTPCPHSLLPYRLSGQVRFIFVAKTLTMTLSQQCDSFKTPLVQVSQRL